MLIRPSDLKEKLYQEFGKSDQLDAAFYNLYPTFELMVLEKFSHGHMRIRSAEEFQIHVSKRRLMESVMRSGWGLAWAEKIVNGFIKYIQKKLNDLEPPDNMVQIAESVRVSDSIQIEIVPEKEMIINGGSIRLLFSGPDFIDGINVRTFCENYSLRIDSWKTAKVGDDGTVSVNGANFSFVPNRKDER